MNFVKISPKLLAPRLPELGQIKIGGKGAERTGSGGKKFRLPEKYTHFVITKRSRDKTSDNLIVDTDLHKVIGSDKPTELDIRLLFDRPEQNFQYFLAAYDGRTKRCSGNGEVAEDRVHGQIPCTCPWLKVHQGPYEGPERPVSGKDSVVCKPHGRLSVILEDAKTFGGFWTFRTTSWESISSIAAQMELYLAQFGFLAGLPLKMVMYPTTDSYEEGGVQKTSTSYKIALVLRGSFDTARQLAASAYERREQLALPSPAQADAHQQQLLEAEERDAAEISAEFHPNTVSEFFEADIVEEVDPEAEKLEELVRLTLDYCDWEQDRINQYVAKFSDDLPGAISDLENKAKKRLQKARIELGLAEPPAEVQPTVNPQETDSNSIAEGAEVSDPGDGAPAETSLPAEQPKEQATLPVEGSLF